MSLWFAEACLLVLFYVGIKIPSNLKKDRTWVSIYNDLKKTAQARLLYNRRKPSIEPCFSLIKTVFDLQGDKQLTYKGLKKNASFLMIATLAIQVMMYQNFIHNKDFGSNQAFLNACK